MLVREIDVFDNDKSDITNKALISMPIYVIHAK